VPTDPRAAWYAWRNAGRNPLAYDPLANYEYGVKVGQRLAIERTASWAGLVPLLQDVLDYLIETAIQRDIDAGVNLTGVDGSSQATSLAGAVPDPTVERPGVEVGS
jgi:hypothetical protein